MGGGAGMGGETLAKRGVFIVLEGTDGSGKTTQFKLLEGRLSAVGYDVAVFDFPRYSEPSSHFVKEYLNGAYGPASQINPYAASLFYALDRFEASKDIREALSEGKVVLSNRYVGSNMAHQGSKFLSEAEQRGFFLWADSMEYQLLGIPRPDINIYLRVPPDVSYRLVAQKATRDYTKRTRDEHESDINHLKKSVATYDLMARLFPKDFRPIECTRQGRLQSVTAINDAVWGAIQPVLHPGLTRRDPRGKTVRLSSAREPSHKSRPPGPVGQATPVSGSLDKERVKMISLRAVAELMTVEGVGVALDERIYQQPSPSLLRPPGLKPADWKRFQEMTGELAAVRRQLAKEITQTTSGSAGWLMVATTPLAAMVDAEIFIDSEKTSQVRARLTNSELAELVLVANTVGKKTSESAAVATAQPGRKEPEPARLSGSVESLAEIVDFWPRNEFDILTFHGYGRAGGLATDELASSFEGWDYGKKREELTGIFVDSSQYDSLARWPHYELELLASPPAMEFLHKNRLIEIIDGQHPNPRNGYEMPAIGEKLGIDTLYEQCFEISLNLYSYLQHTAQPELASYAALAGHRGRYLASTDHRKLQRLAGAFAGKNYPQEALSVAESILEKVREVHPITSASLNVLKIDEAPEIERRADDPKPKPTKSRRLPSAKPAVRRRRGK